MKRTKDIACKKNIDSRIIKRSVAVRRKAIIKDQWFAMRMTRSERQCLQVLSTEHKLSMSEWILMLIAREYKKKAENT